MLYVAKQASPFNIGGESVQVPFGSGERHLELCMTTKGRPFFVGFTLLNRGLIKHERKLGQKPVILKDDEKLQQAEGESLDRNT